MSRETWDDRTQILLNVLQARHGEELCASELAEVTGIKKAYVRRALTINADQQTPIPGVSMQFRMKPDGRLKQSAYWFSWSGHSS